MNIEMNLTENNGNVTGTYSYKNGRINAKKIEIPGSTILEGTWTQSNNSGWLKFKLSSDGRTFNGEWGYTKGSSAEGSWNGTKK